MAKEMETTLVVDNDDPLDIMEKISAQGTLGPYRLSIDGVLSLKDIYYDTPSRLLSYRGIALRTREHGSSQFFCIKQGEQVDDTGTAVRDEIEMPWSRRCMDHIAHILHELQAAINEAPPWMGSPHECLASLGLVAIQERETTRMTLAASLPGSPREGPLAELALDRVCYLIGRTRILHHEVEIEAADADAMDHIRDITGILSDRYGPALRPWRHNKLVTGFALEQLIAERKIFPRSDGYAHLTGQDYDAIEAVLKNFQVHGPLRPAS